MADRVFELVSRLHEADDVDAEANAFTDATPIETMVARTRALFRRRERSTGTGKFQDFTHSGPTSVHARSIHHYYIIHVCLCSVLHGPRGAA